MRISTLLVWMVAAVSSAENFTAADRSFSLQSPAGWRMRATTIAGQAVYVAEPGTGGPEKIFVGSGVSAAATIEELTQQAAAVAAQVVPGLRPVGPPRRLQHGAMPAAEVRYTGGIAQGAAVSGWHGVVWNGAFFFGVLALAPPQSAERVSEVARAMFVSAQLATPARNTRLEQALVGAWVLDDNRSSGLGTSSSVMVMSHWRILLQANGRFQSNSETFVSSESRGATLDTNGSVGSGNTVTGTWAVYGNTLLAEVAGKGRRVYTVKLSGGAMLLDGMLFVRP